MSMLKIKKENLEDLILNKELWIERGMDPNKGILLIGPVGTGKTTVMKKYMSKFYTNPNNGRIAAHMIDQRILNSGDYHSMGSIGDYPLFMDELGSGGFTIVNNYGNKSNPSDDLIDIRSKSFVNREGGSTRNYFCTNYLQEELINALGIHAYDRLVQMCNIVIVTGDSYRK